MKQFLMPIFHLMHRIIVGRVLANRVIFKMLRDFKLNKPSELALY